MGCLIGIIMPTVVECGDHSACRVQVLVSGGLDQTVLSFPL